MLAWELRSVCPDVSWSMDCDAVLEDERMMDDKCTFGAGTGAPCTVIQVGLAGLA